MIFLKPSDLYIIVKTYVKLYPQYLRKSGSINKFLHPSIKSKKINKYYIGSGIAGVFVDQCVNGVNKRVSNQCFDVALFFSNWSRLLIILDSYQDLIYFDKEVSLRTNILVSEYIFQAILDADINIPIEKKNDFHTWLKTFDIKTIEGYFIGNENSLLQVTIEFTSSLIKCLQNSSTDSFKISKTSAVIDEMISLMNAQISSQGQHYYNEYYNWNWYFNCILKNKFDSIFGLLLKAIPINEETSEQSKSILHGIYKINELVLHRQILDDLIDWEEDIDNGILATPTYLLLAYDMDERILTNGGFENLILEKVRNNTQYTKGDFIVTWSQDKLKSKTLVKNSKIINYFLEVITLTKRDGKIDKEIISIINKNREVEKCLQLYKYRVIRSLNKLLKKQATVSYESHK
jgi:hypothetical protein